MTARKVALFPAGWPQVGARGVDYESMQRAPKLVEYWRWRYRDAKTGRILRTLFQLTDVEAAKLPKAERIAGSMLLRELDAEDLPDSGPEDHRAAPDSPLAS